MTSDDQTNPPADPTAMTAPGDGTSSDAATSVSNSNSAAADGPRWAPEVKRAMSVDMGRVVDAPLSQADATTETNDGPSSSVSSSNGNVAVARQPSVVQLGRTQEDGTGTPRAREAFRTSLLESALIALSVGAIFMIVLSRMRDQVPLVDRAWLNELAIAAGILASGVTVILYSRFSRGKSGPDRVNPWQYGELCARRDYLAASFEAFCPGDSVAEESKAACNEAKIHIQRIDQELGLNSRQQTGSTAQITKSSSRGQESGSPDKWILGTGFVELWQRLHAAEAALYGQRPLPQRLSYANHDLLRLSGCGMENGGVQRERLGLAIATLDTIYRKGIKGITEADIAQINLATETMIGIRKAIDDYRDQSRAGLARTRVHLIWAGIMTAVVAYILLALAILDDVPAYQIVAGAAFFLVGAVAGLIWQLRNSGSQIRSGEDDFGLDAARLIYVPVLSGLAGVGGVLVMAMLYPTLNVVPDTSNGEGIGRAIPSIGDIFNLETNRFGLLVAAVFGLTPDLLINRLQREADRYRTQLESTSIQTRSNDPPVLTEAVVAQIRAALAVKSDGETGATGTSGITGESTTTGESSPAEPSG